jgi:sarcosine oxidase
VNVDVAVLGLGAMGSAAFWQLARRGVDVLGIDRFAPPHPMGSTHGETRITREAIGEGEAYVPLARRSHEIWRELEAEAGESLLHEVGSLIISRADDAVPRPGRTGFIARSLAAARRYGIAHEVLARDEIVRRFPQFRPEDGEIGYFEPGGGYLLPERCVAANLAAGERARGRLLLGTTLIALHEEADHVRLQTTGGSIHAGRVVVSAGAWAGPLLGQPFDTMLLPKRQVMHWFPVQPEWRKAWSSSPVFMWPHGPSGDDFFYGFPSLAGAGAIKTADEFYGAPTPPDNVDRDVPAEDSARMYGAHLAGRLAGIGDVALRAITCLYTVTPDSAFVIDAHPHMPRVLVVSACSGHGFKHSAAIGEAVAQRLVEGSSTIDLSAFRVDRPTLRQTEKM